MMSESQSGCRTNGQNSGTCSSTGEIMLFGVRVKVDPLRKSVSMNDISQYVQIEPATQDPSSNGNNHASAAVAADSGYLSADDAARNQSNGRTDHKRGVPWTEDEHKLFLLGLQKVGKGDWRGISKKYVKTRTPTQVASHAQKYFLRRSSLNRRRRRSSLFYITTDSVATIPMEEQQVHEDNNSLSQLLSMQSSHQISPLSGFPMADLIPSPLLPIKNQMETVTCNNCDQFNGGPTLPARTIQLLPTPDSATREDNYMDQKHETNSLSFSLSLSLKLSLSCDHNNGDGILSVG